MSTRPAPLPRPLLTPLGSPRPTKVTIRNCGKGNPGANEAFAFIKDISERLAHHFRGRKTTTDFFIAGQSAPVKDAPIHYSVTAYITDPAELEWIKGQLTA